MLKYVNRNLIFYFIFFKRFFQTLTTDGFDKISVVSSCLIIWKKRKKIIEEKEEIKSINANKREIYLIPFFIFFFFDSQNKVLNENQSKNIITTLCLALCFVHVHVRRRKRQKKERMVKGNKFLFIVPQQ